MAFQPIRTDRLIVRQAAMQDAAALAARRNDPEVARYQPWPLPFTRSMADELLRGGAAMDGPENGQWWMSTIERQGRAEVVGDVGIKLTEGGNAALIGYTFNRRHQGQGYATEAVEAILAHLFEDRGVGRVGAQLDAENLASARLLERTGFLYEGRTRLSYWPTADRSAVLPDEQPGDDLLYGMTAADWERWRSRSTEPPDQVRLVEITAENRREVLALATHKSQERFVAPVATSFCDALFPPEADGSRLIPLLRAIEADGDLTGFLMLALPTEQHPEPHLWRILVDRHHQRRGIGNRALELVEDLLRADGNRSMLLSWNEGPGSPAPLYLGRGFEPTGEVIGDEIEARKLL